MTRPAHPSLRWTENCELLIKVDCTAYRRNHAVPMAPYGLQNCIHAEHWTIAIIPMLL
jgi:hypothetical protein